MNNVVKSFSRFFRRAHPYTVAYYIGRKNAQNILGCKIQKKSKIFASKQTEEQQH
ncbi:MULTISPECIES: hypothetical protein [Alteromonas]|jgi:hypothetical protein|uniref:Uncharacterized protein n=1 Tax=Alteromonas stellipolaris TaxID=233316 RepID=A0AAW7Z8E7_9ALTE|nr:MULTISPECIES: hypothetical protein [Alteromonas]MBO7923987.1 hypothetical protein [Alteromonas sp. K632G]MBQ4831239.1 hypothetical protein [Alteromonas sp. MMG017]MBZ2163669.1 hypothetical protein [Alteromonas stellipolaris]MCQ8850458.1 hypothetical protein [Alteromonas stellipolaris]MDO6536084.1 hypothetical protein [Alteromonas stellipolaris]